jgi:hypothetical protein
MACDVVVGLAIDHPEHRERVTAALRALLADAVARRQADDDDPLNGCLADALVELRDEGAIALLEQTFELELVDESFIDRESIEEVRSGGPPSHRFHAADPAAYLRGYRTDHASRDFDEELDLLDEELDLPDEPVGAWAAEEPEVTEPIRRTGPALGRNDPCWCGSGRKYKKCHLSLDQE